MAKRKANGRRRAIINHLLGIVLPGFVFAWGVSYATKRHLASLVTGLAMSGTIDAAYLLERAFLRPRLKNLRHDWLQLGLEITLGLLDHVGGALLALFVCSRIFGFVVEVATAWMVVGGMLIGFPIIHGTETALRFYRQLKEKERLEEQLRALAAQAELKALKAQINPHFLFNTLNTIAALTHTDPAQAEATIERLAEMFRYALAGSERGLVPLEEELAFVDGYLEIEQARFGEHLRVTREVAPEVLDVLVPSLILQPLVENTIRHGRGGDGSVDLAIRVRSHEDEVLIVVADHGPGLSKGAGEQGSGRDSPLHPGPPTPPPGRGHGLRNVDERLRKTYGQEYGLEIAANKPQGAVVTVRIPIRGMGGKGVGVWEV